MKGQWVFPVNPDGVKCSTHYESLHSHLFVPWKDYSLICQRCLIQVDVSGVITSDPLEVYVRLQERMHK